MKKFFLIFYFSTVFINAMERAPQASRKGPRIEYKDATTQREMPPTDWRNVATKTACWVALFSCKWAVKNMITSIYNNTVSSSKEN